jgi:hydroxyacylglutathione hydrolase
MSLKIDCHTCGALGNNVYLVFDTNSNEGALIDPAMDTEYLVVHIETSQIRLTHIIDTHGHFDHTFNNKYFKERFPKAELLIHKADVHMLKAQTEMATMFGFSASESPQPDRYLVDGDEIHLGDEKLLIIETPGHTQGSISLYHEGFAIVGDTLFKGSVGRTDLPGGDHGKLLKSIRDKLYVLPDDTVVYSGHGLTTTIGTEKKSNPFIRV